MTTYSTSLRLWEGTPGDPAIRNVWGTALNENCNLLEASILGTVSVSLTGLTSYTLTTANGAADQARPLIQSYTGALTGNCTVTLPNVPKVGWAQNATTGGMSVILTAGAGTTVALPPDGFSYFFWADGSGNVSVPSAGFGALSSTGGVTVGLPQFSSPAGPGVSVSPSGTIFIGAESAPNGWAFLNFLNNSIDVGSINFNGAGVTYNTTSDATLKIGAGSITSEQSGRIVDTIRALWFRWKANPDAEPQPGFFAQQVHRVFPWAVTRGQGRRGRPGYRPWQMDQSKLVPVVIAELQSLRRRVAQLEKGR